MDRKITDKNRIIAARDDEIKNLKKQLDKERKQKSAIQSAYEKKVVEKCELEEKFEDLAIKIDYAIKAKKGEYGMIGVDVVEKALKKASDFIAGFYKNENTEEFESINEGCQILHGDANACELDKFSSDEQQRTVFFGGLPAETSYHEVLKYASKFGDVEQLSTAATGKNTKAVVMFGNSNCIKCLLKGNPHTIKSKKFHVQRFKPHYIKDPASYIGHYFPQSISNKQRKEPEESQRTDNNNGLNTLRNDRHV